MRKLIFLLMMVLGLSLTTGAAAQSYLQLAQAKTAEAAAFEAKQQYGGKVLSVELDADQDPPQYLVKLLRQGQVRIVQIPME